MLNLRGRRVVVFGGGKVAERRVAKLLSAGAEVKVVSMSFSPKLRKLGGKNLRLIQAELSEANIAQHMRGALLVFAATDKTKLNEAIAAQARSEGRLVNRSDAVADFTVPASFEVDDVIIAVSTQGKSPAVAKIIKRRLKKALTQEDILLVELQEFLREALKRRIAEQKDRKRMLRIIARDERILEMLRKGDLEGAKALGLKYLEA